VYDCEPRRVVQVVEEGIVVVVQAVLGERKRRAAADGDFHIFATAYLYGRPLFTFRDSFVVFRIAPPEPRRQNGPPERTFWVSRRGES
jgi:hypothetical protein